MRFRQAFGALAGLAAIATAATGLPGASASVGPGALGVDVSRLEGRIHWQQVADAGVRFAIVEASRGSGPDCTVHPKRCGADPFYKSNYTRARAAGIRVGPYHRAFVGGGSRHEVIADAKREEAVFSSRVGSLQRGDLIPTLDVEPPYAGLGPSRLRLWVRTWLDQVEKALGAKPMIYTSATAWDSLGDTTEFARSGHPLWVANWGVSSPSVPAGDWAGDGWSVWQFTNDRRVPGIAGLPDADRLGVKLAQISVR